MHMQFKLGNYIRIDFFVVAMESKHTRIYFIKLLQISSQIFNRNNLEENEE